MGMIITCLLSCVRTKLLHFFPNFLFDYNLTIPDFHESLIHVLCKKQKCSQITTNLYYKNETSNSHPHLTLQNLKTNYQTPFVILAPVLHTSCCYLCFMPVTGLLECNAKREMCNLQTTIAIAVFNECYLADAIASFTAI